MNKSNGVFLIILVSFLIHCNCFSHVLKPGVKRIVFLGNSITWAGTYVQYVEAFVRSQYPGRQFEFINVGLSSETVSGLSEEGHADGKFPRPDLHERLTRVLAATRPDLVFACYGMNDGIYLPFDSTRFQKFREGMNWLHQQVIQTGAAIVHITPPYYDEMKGGKTGYARVLDRYADWLMSCRKTKQWMVVDVHNPMKTYLLAHRAVDQKFHLQHFVLANDGVHPGDLGHWIMAREILKYLGFTNVAGYSNIVESLPYRINGSKFVKLIAEKQNLLRDAWLSSTKHLRPGLPVGLPLKQALDSARQLQVEIDSLLLNNFR